MEGKKVSEEELSALMLLTDAWFTHQLYIIFVFCLGLHGLLMDLAFAVTTEI